MTKNTWKFRTPLSLIIICLVFLLSVSNSLDLGENQVSGNISVFLTWNSMITGVKNNLLTLPTYATYPENATSWRDYANRTFNDLLIENLSWFNKTYGALEIMGFRPYVKGADGFGVDLGFDWERNHTELMAEMDVLWPMYRYLQLHPNNTRQTMTDDFILELPKYFSSTYKTSTNEPNSDREDSWYFMENSVLKQGHLYLISENPDLNITYFDNLESALEMAHNFNYLFPQFVSPRDKMEHPTNININYCTGGLLAYSLITAYELTQNITYLEEAEMALNAIRGVKLPHKVLYEPQELAAAVAAAARMTQYNPLILNTSTNFAQLALDLFYAQEQMVYYNGGNTSLANFENAVSAWLPSNWREGLHSPYWNPEEASGIYAPAFKENVESVMFWTDFLRNLYFWSEFNIKAPLSILNLNRIKSFYFFSPNIPDGQERSYGPSTLQYIPYEDINYFRQHKNLTYDPPENENKVGYNGKQIYGAGETLWLYLLFEALATISDPNALILNLNTFDRELDPDNASFIVWNPYNTPKEFNITFNLLTAPFEVYINGTKRTEQFQPNDKVNITLPPLASAYISLNNATVPSAPYIPPPPPPTTPPTTPDSVPLSTTPTTSSLPSNTSSLPTTVPTPSSRLLISFLALFCITAAITPRRRKKIEK